MEKDLDAERLQKASTQDLETSKEILAANADDEAAKVLNKYDGPLTWSDEEERKLRKKIDWRLMPILCITYGLQYYDKAMIGQAALFGLTKDLELTIGNRYSFASAIFYLGFIAGAYPSSLLAQRYPIERVVSGTVTLWGICLLLTITCFDYRSLYAQRFFLGFLESGVSPMFMLIVGSWYKKDEQAFRMGMWYSLTGFASVLSPLINYGLGQVRDALSPWKYMYIFAGSLTTFWGLLLLFLLPPDPIRARGYDDRQRYILVARLRTNNSGVVNTTFKKAQALEIVTDLKFWLVFWIALLSMITNGPISSFIPTIINGFGFNTLDSLLLVMPAGAIAGSLMLLMGWLAYKFSKNNIRTYLIFGTQCFTILANALLWKLDRRDKGGLLYAVYTLSVFGSGYSVLMGLLMANTAGYTKRALASSGIYVGYCFGNFIGPQVFLETEAPIYDTGFTVTTITAAIAAALVLVYRVVCMWENRKRDATGIAEAFDHAYEDPTDKTNKQFRYVM